MGSCFTDRNKKYKSSGNGTCEDGSLDPTMNEINMMTKSSVIKIKQNPNTSKLQGVPRKLVDNGYFNRQIVEMDKVVDD
jgi:hypothetical protein